MSKASTKDHRTEWAWLETARSVRLATWPIKHDLTPVQYCVLACCQRFHNEMLLVAPKGALRVLVRRGLITKECYLTKAGELLLLQMIMEDCK